MKIGEELSNAFVHALVEGAAGDRLQRVAILLRVQGGGVPVELAISSTEVEDSLPCREV